MLSKRGLTRVTQNFALTTILSDLFFDPELEIRFERVLFSYTDFIFYLLKTDSKLYLICHGHATLTMVYMSPCWSIASVRWSIIHIIDFLFLGVYVMCEHRFV